MTRETGCDTVGRGERRAQILMTPHTELFSFFFLKKRSNVAKSNSGTLKRKLTKNLKLQVQQSRKCCERGHKSFICKKFCAFA